MEPRTISIGLIAIVAAFAVAFGAGKATSSKTATAGVRAAAIKVAAPPAVSSVQVGGAIPALQAKAQKKSPAKKTKKATSKTTATTNSTASAPSTTNSAPQTQTKVTPKVQAPVKKTPAKPKSTTGGGGAVNGGGVDG